MRAWKKLAQKTRALRALLRMVIIREEDFNQCHFPHYVIYEIIANPFVSLLLESEQVFFFANDMKYIFIGH